MMNAGIEELTSFSLNSVPMSQGEICSKEISFLVNSKSAQFILYCALSNVVDLKVESAKRDFAILDLGHT